MKKIVTVHRVGENLALLPACNRSAVQQIWASGPAPRTPWTSAGPIARRCGAAEQLQKIGGGTDLTLADVRSLDRGRQSP